MKGTSDLTNMAAQLVLLQTLYQVTSPLSFACMALFLLTKASLSELLWLTQSHICKKKCGVRWNHFCMWINFRLTFVFSYNIAQISSTAGVLTV